MISAVDCRIERRLLLNYRIEPERVAQFLPPPLRPQLVQGWAVGGICIIRLGELRVPHVPRAMGLTTDNIAHRFAVEWDDENGRLAGVYIPRRDTGSRLTAWAGGRIFPGDHRLARFTVLDDEGHLEVDVESRDGEVRIDMSGRESASWEGTLFATVDEACQFFRSGCLGLSPAKGGRQLDGVRLVCPRWEARAVAVGGISSSVFEDPRRFPAGSCVFDSALVVRNLEARWESFPVRLGDDHAGAVRATSRSSADRQTARYGGLW